MKLDMTELLDGLEVVTHSGRGSLNVTNKGKGFVDVSYVYRRSMDRMDRKRSLMLRKNVVLNKSNVYRIALLVSEGSHLRPDKTAKTNYFKFTSTSKPLMREALQFLFELVGRDDIKFELKRPVSMSEQQAIRLWSDCINGSPNSISRSNRVGVPSCGAYINNVFMTHVIDKIAETTIELIAHDKNLLTSWFAGRIDGDGSVHPTYQRIDIAYHKTDEAKLMRAEKAFLHSMGVKTVKDRLLDGKNITVVQICGLDNMIKLFDTRMSPRNRSRMLSLVTRARFYIGLNRRFRDSLPDQCSSVAYQKNWNRYLAGSRRVPLSVFENTIGSLPIKHIESIRYGSKIISDKGAIRNILDARRLAGGEDIVRDNRLCR